MMPLAWPQLFFGFSAILRPTRERQMYGAKRANVAAACRLPGLLLWWLHRLDLLARAGEPNTAGRCAMEQVADRLDKLGLGQYAQRFAENGR